MARGVIVANLGDGLYTVNVNFNRDYADTKLDALSDEISQYTVDIAAKEIEKTAQQIVVDAALVDRDAAAQTYQTSPTESNFKALNESQAVFLSEVVKLNAIRNAISMLEIRKQGANKGTSYIGNNIPADYNVVSWCADYTTDMVAGDVVGLISIGKVDQVGDGTQVVTQSQYPAELTAAMEAEVAELEVLKAAVEQELEDFITGYVGLFGIGATNTVNAFIKEIQILSVRINATNQGIIAILNESGYDPSGVPILSTWYIIQPGKGSANSTYDIARDGDLTPIVSMSGASAYYNNAILPGVAKWRPSNRLGKITSIDYAASTADVDLDYLASTWQGLNVNQSDTLSTVPIEYGTCNAGAFNVDDRVAVGFDDFDWNQPKIIGFESEPKPCAPRYALVLSQGFGFVWDIDSEVPLVIPDVTYPAPFSELEPWIDSRTLYTGDRHVIYSEVEEGDWPFAQFGTLGVPGIMGKDVLFTINQGLYEDQTIRMQGDHVDSSSGSEPPLNNVVSGWETNIPSIGSSYQYDYSFNSPVGSGTQVAWFYVNKTPTTATGLGVENGAVAGITARASTASFQIFSTGFEGLELTYNKVGLDWVFVSSQRYYRTTVHATSVKYNQDADSFDPRTETRLPLLEQEVLNLLATAQRSVIGDSPVTGVGQGDLVELSTFASTLIAGPAGVTFYI